MNQEPLLASFAKIERAETHIKQLNKEINAFFKISPYKIITKINSDKTEEVWSFRLDRKLPAKLEGLTADALQNLRSPLDKMLDGVARHLKLEPRGIKFPFGRTEKKFEAALANQGRILPSSAIDLLRQTKAYSRGNPLLFALHDMNIGDKHHDTLVPINLGFGFTVSKMVVDYGKVLRIGYRYGAHLILDEFSGNFIASQNGKMPMIIKDGKLVTVKGQPAFLFEPDINAGDNDLEFLAVTPETKFQADFEPSLNIAFSKIEGFEREPIVSCLYQMRDLVQGILLTFRDEFFA